MTPAVRRAIAGLALSAAAFVGIATREGYTDNTIIPTVGDVPTNGFGTTKGVKMGDVTNPVKALQRALEAKEVAAKVYVGMRYWHPFTEEAMGEMKRDGVNRLVVLPLYPQFSITTSGSSLRLLEKMFREDEYLVEMQHTVIPSWFQRRGYVEAMAGLIAREMGRMPIPEEVRS